MAKLVTESEYERAKEKATEAARALIESRAPIDSINELKEFATLDKDAGLINWDAIALLLIDMRQRLAELEKRVGKSD